MAQVSACPQNGEPFLELRRLPARITHRHVSDRALCGSLRAGERILRSVREFLADKLKLIVNETKSRVVKLAEASFLGFRIVRRKVRWTAKSLKKFKAKVRRITKRTRGHSPKKVIADLQSYLRGAFNYYGLGIGFGEARCEAGSLSHADAMR